MPNPPYGPDNDHSELFRSSGASLLLELGRLVVGLLGAVPGFALPVDSKRAKDVREQIAPKLEAVKAFFEANPKAAMTKHVLARTGGKVDSRVCLAVAYLAACAVEHYEESVPLMRAARAVSLCGDPAEVLEARRLLAALGTHGMIEISKIDGQYSPKIRLAAPVMHDILGGDRCLPVIDPGVFQQVAWERRRRIGHSAGSRGGHQTPLPPVPSVLSAAYIASQVNGRVIGLKTQVGGLAARISLHLTRAQALKENKALDTPNEAILMLGSSGTGKSFVFKTAAQAAGLPHASFNSQEITRAGIVGSDVEDAFYPLTIAAGGDPEKARFGMLLYDEWKPAGVAGDSLGIGTTAVQQAILTILSGGEFQVGGKRGAWGGFRPFSFNSVGTCFFFAANIPMLGRQVEISKAGGIGFSGPSARKGDAALRHALISLGYIEEFLNRLTLVMVLPDPTAEALCQSVCQRTLDSTWNVLLERRGLRIELEPEASWLAAEASLDNRMLYRGPRAVVGYLVQDLVLNEATGTVRLGVEDVRRALDALDGKETPPTDDGGDLGVDDSPVTDVMA